jgi:glyoxylase-like metal-dependent hydrolase (beta-lactamase superfamily II)
MRSETTPPAASSQRQLSDFLYAELLHTLGAYRLASDRLDVLTGGLGDTRAEATLRDAAHSARRCNQHLQADLHRPHPTNAPGPPGPRHPSPFPEGEEVPEFPDEELLRRIAGFYGTAATALALNLHDPGGTTPGHRLGARLAIIQDPQRRTVISDDHHRTLMDGRVDRMLARYNDVTALLDEPPPPIGGRLGSASRSGDARHFRQIINDHVGVQEHFHAPHLTILEALSEAHLWMHYAEHLRSQSFGAMFTTVPETHAEMHRMLHYSVVLNTFVFVAGRAVSWVFAEDDEERGLVFDDYRTCCEKLTPTYCMWIGSELSLLALHRRAYARWTMGRQDYAYRDFYKLARLMRGLRKQVDQRASRVPGTKTFIEGMTGMAEHHIGRIYRGQHAHRMALRYFDRASFHLKGWEGHEEVGEIMKNSRWRLNLLINEGKANYELGRVKRSLLYYARAWRAFLVLTESESHATANVEVVEEFIKWLAPTVDEPELSRRELGIRLEPLVEQFETVRSPVHLRLLAADIVMRLGHLLFILKLPPAGWGTASYDGPLPPVTDHRLAFRCISHAGALDPSSTLIASDLLKIKGEAGLGADELPEPRLAQQWPAGSGRFEEAARIIEYTLQRWLAAPSNGVAWVPTAREDTARKLLGSFLAHTDSSNVKLAQVYRYLMQETRVEEREIEKGSATLDFVCMRRYSSFFPFLPRPSAFRAPGGGYFVQAREAGDEPFGIAIDPGPDFIENLYRCGYALDDIHMILVTHDHADHLASLDALLALMGIRAGLGDDTFDLGDPDEDRRGERLVIVGNESVCRRYEFFNERHPVFRDDEGEPAIRRDAVKVLRFEEIGEITELDGKRRKEAIEEAEIFLPSPSLRIEPVKSVGHTDAHGYIAQGFLLAMEGADGRSSILFTSDTGLVPSARRPPAKGSKSLLDAAAEADVVVAHLSAVPLRELREIAGLESGSGEPDAAIAEFQELWKEVYEALPPVEERDPDEDKQKGIERARFLLRQLQFGFRSRAAKDEDGFSVSPFSPFGKIKKQPEQHLYLGGLLDLAERMAQTAEPDRPPLLLIGELREELGTFRTRIANHIATAFFGRDEAIEPGDESGEARPSGNVLTTDIGLRVRLSSPRASVLCTTCDLDNDLIAAERFHPPDCIREVCVKGEDEGVFYNCLLHDPRRQEEQAWLESVERYDVFGD